MIYKILYLVPLNDSISNASSDRIKLEPTIANNDDIPHQQFDTKLGGDSKLFMQLHQTQYDRLPQPSNQLHQVIPLVQQQTNEFDLAEKVLFNLSDITHISNGSEQIISSETIHHNLDESAFDTL